MSGTSDDTNGKKNIAGRVWITRPFPGLWEGCSWTYDESVYRQRGVVVPLGKLPVPGPKVDFKMATLIFLIGGPGSGKSTIAANLAADLGLIQIDPNAIVKRLSLNGPSEAWFAVESAMDDHGVVPEEIINVLLKMEISMHLEVSEGVFLIEGFPQSYKQFKEFGSICDYGLAISLEVSSATLMRRVMPDDKSSFSKKVTKMDNFLRSEDAFSAAEDSLYPHSNFTDKLVKVCAELEVTEYYPRLKDLVENQLANPQTPLPIKELGMEIVFPIERSNLEVV
ncbi:hypothetical protein BBP40_001011 [Aspergillus hancockii]|nr:hypothetical protein BBP40_001011 [Aspergillus hancockii]